MNTRIDSSRPKYVEQAFKLRCFPAIQGLFPNLKEITESFGAYEAAKSLGWHFSDPTTTVLAVGDGKTPRTAATFAFRTAWNCVSVDPMLKRAKYPYDRLTLFQGPVEAMPVLEAERVLLVAVHSHARLSEAIKRVRAPHLAVIAIPCCVPQMLGTAPNREFQDPNIWSPCRTVKVWESVGGTH